MENRGMKREKLKVQGSKFKVFLALALVLALAAPALGAQGFGQRTGGWYAPDKDPAAVLDYDIDWGAWLGGDTIATSDWVVGSGITSGAKSKTNTVVTIWLSGGTAGTTYALKNTITTAGGRTQVRRFKISVKEK